MPIYISEDAFISLTLSAIETSILYEASGLLLGYKVDSTYFVQNAIPYQVVKRTRTSVSVSHKKQERIRRVFKNYMKYRIIGEYHTHPDGSVELSDGDIDFIRERDYQLETVVAIAKDGDSKPWNYERGILSGTIDNYYIKIGCWRVKERTIDKLAIRCPFAVGFDFSKPFA